MDKAQAFQKFWSSFGLPAYDETTVPDGEHKPDFPYITYNFQSASMENLLFLDISIWYRTNSWEEVEKKKEEIAKRLQIMHPPTIKVDGGRLALYHDTLQSRRMTDFYDPTIRRYSLNITAEFFTAY